MEMVLGFVGICIINMVNGFIYIYTYIYLYLYIKYLYFTSQNIKTVGFGPRA
jgi:hypothetical protein